MEGGGEDRGGGKLSNDGAIFGTVGEDTIFDIGGCRRWMERERKLERSIYFLCCKLIESIW